MSSSAEIRNYRFKDTDLVFYAMTLCSILTDRIDDFADYALTPEKISAFHDLIDVFKNFPSDSYCKNIISEKTEDKNLLRNKVLLKIRGMALRVEAEWGNNSSKYSRLEVGSLARLSDDLLLVKARNVHSKMVENLLDLGSQGLTQIELDIFENLNTQFELALIAQADAVNDREIRLKERIQKGNEIYALVTKYCNYGKLIYEHTSPAKYNDFLIYKDNRK
jgi:hypothetical protein